MTSSTDACLNSASARNYPWNAAFAMPDSVCPALKVFIGDEWMTVEDASQTAPDVLREVLTDAFAFVSLTPHTVPRIQLGSQRREWRPPRALC